MQSPLRDDEENNTDLHTPDKLTPNDIQPILAENQQLKERQVSLEASAATSLNLSTFSRRSMQPSILSIVTTNR